MDFVIAELNFRVRADGRKYAQIIRKEIVDKAVANGISCKDMEAAIIYLLLSGLIIKQENVLRFPNNGSIDILPSQQHRTILPGRVVHKPARAKAYSIVKDIVESRTDLVPKTEKLEPKTMPNSMVKKTIFIGHGQSNIWLELQNFLRDRIKIQTDEFNSISVAGIPTIVRLEQALDSAVFAFLIMTAEDEQPDGTVRARQNVVHEAGLFQGRLGFRKAIILLEESCKTFSNIEGLSEIRFPRGNLRSAYEEIRHVLEREGIIKES